MLLKRKELQFTIIVYLLFVLILLYNRNTFFYDNNNNLKQFGTGKNKTIFPLWLVLLLGGIISFLIVNIFIF